MSGGVDNNTAGVGTAESDDTEILNFSTFFCVDVHHKEKPKNMCFFIFYAVLYFELIKLGWTTRHK